jgi:hypothetical protein
MRPREASGRDWWGGGVSPLIGACLDALAKHDKPGIINLCFPKGHGGC